jgi:AcrR family transcriptional regulator
MIDTAERLIAERGLPALSLREVAAEAGQRNHSAVQYHFGSRSGLVEAVFDARMRPIDARRAEMLAELEGAGRTGDLAALADVIVRPLAEAVIGDSPGWYGRFLVEVQRSEPELLTVDRPVMASLHRAGELTVAAMVEVPGELRSERLVVAIRSAVAMLADRELLAARGLRRGSPPNVFVAPVVDLAHAMLAAPPSPELLAEIEAVRAEPQTGT